MGLGVGCGLVFCVAFGFGCSTFAVVSLAISLVRRWFWSFRGALVSFVRLLVRVWCWLSCLFLLFRVFLELISRICLGLIRPCLCDPAWGLMVSSVWS